MAELVGAVFTSHAAWVDTPPVEWDAIRALRHHRADVPSESDREKADKARRTQAAKQRLRNKLDEMAPDALIIFGDDQTECFDFTNLPAISVYAGEKFAGPRRSAPRIPNLPSSYVTVPGHPRLASSVLSGLMAHGFDPALSLSASNPVKGMCHAVMTPLAFFGRYSTPTVPILINAYYAPQVTARRCYQLGRAVREIIANDPSELRVAVIGSGGLWHTPNHQDAYLNEEFDRRGLEFLEEGQISQWCDFFDSYVVSDDDKSQLHETGAVTGLPSPGGPQIGTRETCNWIAAASVIDHRPCTIVDYIPVYASPIGLGFAYCDRP